MASRRRIFSQTAMASRWRRRSLCVLIDAIEAGCRPFQAALREVSGAGALVETSARPPLGRAIELHHPEAGMIRGEVIGIGPEGVRIAFDRSTPSIAFALAAITADMSRPA